LAGNQITTAGAEALAASPFLARLRRLDLSANQVTAAGARALLSSPYGARLREVVLHDDPIGEEEWAELLSRFGEQIKVGDHGPRSFPALSPHGPAL
jgi:hypothetical protein